MASIQKRGRYYYGRWQKIENGERFDVRKSLKVRYKDMAEKAIEQLEQLEAHGEIDPYCASFDPVQALKELNSESNSLKIKSVRAAADYFYKKKAHLSNSTVKNAEKRTVNNSGAYEQAIEHFIKLNDIAGLSPMLVKQQHFENIIFKPGIAASTRHFYFRQLRVWWNKLLEWNIVKKDYLAAIKNDLPDKKSNTRAKMLSESELQLLFKAFDDDLKKKKKEPYWNDSLIQHWFKPIMATYFYCGLRRHEAAFKSDLPYSGLKKHNLYYENDVPEMIHLPATKGRKERSIPIPEACKKYLIEYLKIRGHLEYDSYIFVYTGTRRKGYPVTGATAYKQFKHYLEKAKLPATRTIHGMRHQRVTSWLENSYNTSEAQFMAGHSSVKTTEGYTHLTGKNLLKKQREMEKRVNATRKDEQK